MDSENAPQIRPGGVVEPTSRTRAAAKPAAGRFERLPEERYELRDPTSQTIHRISGFSEVTAKADQLRVTKIDAIRVNGERTTLEKVDGRWYRSSPDRSRAAAKNEPATSRPQVARQDPGPATPDQGTRKTATEPDRAARAAQIEAALLERYVIKRAPTIGPVALGQTEYRYRGDTSRVAFTESTSRLATDHNSPSVARSMVDVAEARNWKGLRVSGHEDFRRMVWLEASLRGVKTIGYEPQVADQELLRKEREGRALNRIEPTRTNERSSQADDTPASAAKQSARGSGGRKAVLAALEAVLVAKAVPERQREAVMAAAGENLGRRVSAGQTLKVKVLDKDAPSQRVVSVPPREMQRTPERAAPAR